MRVLRFVSCWAVMILRQSRIGRTKLSPSARQLQAGTSWTFLETRRALVNREIAFILIGGTGRVRRTITIVWLTGLRFFSTFSDKGSPRAQRIEALKFLVHFVGDLHQPVHAREDARGGNDIHVVEFGRRNVDRGRAICILRGTLD